MATGTAQRDYRALDYGADPSGQRDSSAAIASALNDLLGSAGTVGLPPGRYRLDNPIVVQSGLANSTSPVPYPGLACDAPPGRIGDANDDSAVELFCSGQFPQGHYALQYLAPNNNVAPSGFELANLGIKCNGVGAGVLLVQPRMARVSGLSIDHAADGSASGSPVGAASTGAFTAWQTNGTAAAYNTFEKITTAYGAKDGIVHNLNGDDLFQACWDLNAARYAFNCQGMARWIACHYEQSQYGILVVTGAAVNTFIGWDYFGIPTLNAVQLSSNYSGSGTNHPAQFVGCRLAVNPTAVSATSVPILAQGNNALLAHFTNCAIVANGADVATWAVAYNTLPAGSEILFDACDFIGSVTSNPPINDDNSIIKVRNSSGFNPRGLLNAPAVPTSGTAITNNFNVDVTVYVAGGSVSAIAVEGGATGMTSGPIRVPAGQTITLTYTAAPGWVWFGD